MAPLLVDGDGSRKLNSRQAALEEAASVLRAVTSSSSGGVESHPKNGGATTGGSAAQRNDDGGRSDDAVAVAPAVEHRSAVATKGDDDATTDARPTTNPPPVPKLSRSDAVAAAKRRAEERKRRAASQHGEGKKPPPTTAAASSSSATAAESSSSSSSSAVVRSPPRTSDPRQSRRTASDGDGRGGVGGGGGSMDWFNLLGVVTNPGVPHGAYDDLFFGASPPSASSHRHSSHGRHGLSSHGTPISSDHVGSDGSRGLPGSGHAGGAAPHPTGAVAGSLLSAAGLGEWASSANASAAGMDAALSDAAARLDEFTGWFDHYSRKYLGTMDNYSRPILGETYGSSDVGGDGESGGLGNLIMNNLMHPHPRGVRPDMLCEYEPEFGPDDAPAGQLAELPPELGELDLASVEEFLKGGGGMLGMRFEDRGGGFRAARERRRNDDEAAEKKEEEEEVDDAAQTNDNEKGEADDDNGAAMMAEVESLVPATFFSPYFDLTDPACFENLLVIGDEEVAQIREKEAELRALADRKVRKAEEAAELDAENENVVARPPPKKSAESGEEQEAAAASRTPGTSLTKDAKTTSSPARGGGDTVITLRKPETFTSHLDAVELVLLDQVRSKSERFFRETNRFSELQRLVSTSVEEVRALRTELASVRERCVTNVEAIPAMDDGRRDLRAVSRALEAAEDVANCKASVASLMGAGDHLGAVEAIRLARELLKGSPEDEEENDDDEEEDVEGSSRHSTAKRSSSHSSQQRHNHLSLGKLKALSKVSEQLDEYEKLVVQNLTDELVETFLSWGANSDASSSNPPRASLTTDKRAQIRGAVGSLRLCGKLSGAGAAYRRRLCELISVTVRAIVTECVADAAKDSPSSSGNGGSDADRGAAKGTVAGVAHMSLEQFFDCIDMLFEQVLALLWGAFAVNRFCIDEGFVLDDDAAGALSSSGSADAEGRSSSSGEGGERATRGGTPRRAPSATAAALAAAADLSEKSVSELLRLRREAHSLVSFDGMRRLWDTSLTFTHRLEKFSGRKAYGLRSTLLAQAKSFVERKHEANMSALAAAMDGERWVQCSVSAERQAALTRLSSGRAAFSSRKTITGEVASSASTSPSEPGKAGGGSREKMTDAEVEGTRYKVVWSCLLLLEMITDDVACAAHFQTLAANVVSKVAELLRLFNARATQLVLGAGAIHSAARLKSINAKHLAIVTQCIALALAVLPHVRAALMAQLPAKQHALLYDLDKIKADYKEHSEKILSKLVSIIGGIVEHSLGPRIAKTDFDARARGALERASMTTPDRPDPSKKVECCQFLDAVVTNTRKMHQVLLVMLPAELLRDVFSRIFAYLDHKVPSLFKAAASAEQTLFSMPATDDGKLQMIGEVEYMARTLNGLQGVEPWNFTATKILEQELDIVRKEEDSPPESLPGPVVEEAETAEPREDEREGENQIEKTMISDTNEGGDAKEETKSCPKAEVGDLLIPAEEDAHDDSSGNVIP